MVMRAGFRSEAVEEFTLLNYAAILSGIPSLGACGGGDLVPELPQPPSMGRQFGTCAE
jgi:hypothetical protein